MKLKNQAGLSLIELLVALSLGLFLVAGIVQVFVGSRQTFEVTRANSIVQEAGRFGVSFIARSVRQAGYINAGVVDTEFAQTAFNFSSPSGELWPIQNGFQDHAVITGTDGANANEPDSVSIRLQGDADGVLVDCEGVALTTDDTLIVRMTFSVNTDTNELNCQVFDGVVLRNTVALVSGIEDMQVLYGVATNFAQPNVVGKYVSATDMAADEWDDIVAVRIGLLAVSENSPLSTTGNGIDYTLLDKEIADVNDGFARQVFTQTVAIRSQLSG